MLYRLYGWLAEKFTKPKKVIRLPFKVNGTTLYGYNCPRCRRYIYTTKSPEVKWCEKCGQRLDWNITDESVKI